MTGVRRGVDRVSRLGRRGRKQNRATLARLRSMAAIALALLLVAFCGLSWAASTPSAGVDAVAPGGASWDSTSPSGAVIVIARPGSVGRAEPSVRRLEGEIRSQLAIINGFSATLPEDKWETLEQLPYVVSVTGSSRIHAWGAACSPAGRPATGVRFRLQPGSGPVCVPDERQLRPVLRLARDRRLASVRGASPANRGRRRHLPPHGTRKRARGHLPRRRRPAALLRVARRGPHALPLAHSSPTSGPTVSQPGSATASGRRHRDPSTSPSTRSLRETMLSSAAFFTASSRRPGSRAATTEAHDRRLPTSWRSETRTRSPARMPAATRCGRSPATSGATPPR